MKNWKARLAKEWLIFLPLVLLTMIFFAWIDVEGYIKEMPFATRRTSDSVLVWIATLFPYLIVQIVRSIVWSVKTVRHPPE